MRRALLVCAFDALGAVPNGAATASSSSSSSGVNETIFVDEGTNTESNKEEDFFSSPAGIAIIVAGSVAVVGAVAGWLFNAIRSPYSKITPEETGKQEPPKKKSKNNRGRGKSQSRAREVKLDIAHGDLSVMPKPTR